MTKTINKNINIMADMCNDYVRKFLENNEELLNKWEAEEDVFKSLFNVEKPNKVKRNCSAYNFFCKAQRIRLKEENPDITEAELKSQISVLWKETKDDEDECAEYKEMAEKDKERYQTDKAASGDDGQKKKKKLKDKNKPKKALSAYFIWGMEERVKIKKEHPDMKATDVGVELGLRWAEVKKDSKKMIKYNKAAEVDKNRYQDAMKSYVRPSDEELLASKKTKKTAVPKPKKTKKKVEKVESDTEKSITVDEEESVVEEATKKSKMVKPKKAKVEKTKKAKTKPVEEPDEEIEEEM